MLKNKFQKQLVNIQTFIFDIDGVMTDGSVGALASGEMFRTFFIRDGYAIERAINAGYRICIITGGNQEGVRKRLEYLKINDIFMGSGGKSKLDIYLKYIKDRNIDESTILYMGDDLPDQDVMSRPAIASTAPFDAIDEIKLVSDYVSHLGGGKGAVRDVIEQVMKAQEKW